MAHLGGRGARREARSLPFVFLVGAALGGCRRATLGGYLSDRIGRRRVILVGEAADGRSTRSCCSRSSSSMCGRPRGADARRRRRLARRLGRPGDGRRPRPARAARGGVRVGPGRGEPRCGHRAAARWPRAAPRLAGTRSSRRVACSPRSRGSSLLAATPHRGEFIAGGPAGARLVRNDPRDRPFLSFLGSAVFAWLVYVAYEVVLPVSLVDGFGYDPAAWGFIVWINPLLVTLLSGAA